MLTKANCHLIKTAEGHYLLFKGSTFALFEADQIIFDILQKNYPLHKTKLFLDLSADYSKEDLNDSVEEMKKWKILFESEPSESTTMSRPEFKPESKPSMGSLWLSVTNDCNLRCKYCAADHGFWGGEPALMNKEIAKQAIDMLFTQSKGRTNLSITLIGGEPLLNFDVIKFSVEYGHRLANELGVKISFVMNTNGTVLTDEMIEFLSRNGVDVVFSIDGPKTIHDKNRVFADGTSSFGTVIENLNKWLRTTRRSCRIQSTFPDPADMEESIMYFFNMGIRIVVANPAVKTKFSHQQADPSQEQQDQIIKTYEKMGKYLLETLLKGKPKGLFSTIQMMKLIHHRNIKTPGCGAGESLSIDAWGNIYPCQGMIGWKDYRLGDVFTGVDENLRLEVIKQKNEIVYKCKTCWAKYICGAACLANALSNDIIDAEYPSTECELRRKLIETAIQAYHELMRTAPELAEKYFRVAFTPSEKCC